MTIEIQDDLFDVAYLSIPRPGRNVVFECFHLFFTALGKCLDAAVLQISNITAYLMRGGGPLGEKSKADALDLTAD